MVVLLVSLGLFKYLTKWHSQLRSQLAEKTSALAGMQALMTERDLWVERDNFINGKQPALTNEVGAGVPLLEETKAAADKFSVIIKDQTILGVTASKSSDYKPVTITFKTTSTKDDLRKFLYELQAPDRFIVFEKVTLKLDETDKSKMAGTFNLAKWFAPVAPR